MDTGKCVCPGQELNAGPLYQLPFASVFSYSIAAPVIGMATGAYESHVSYMAERVRASYGNKAAEDPFSQVRVAEAASDIDAAWLQLERNIGEEYALASAGEKIPFALRLRVRRDQVRATQRSIGAVDRLFENSGGKALNVGTPIQRFWRDAHAGRVHAINDPERALAMFGQSELGLKVQDAWL
jgi:3-hydroxy-9,10-secoandrosta-1,3,5(10)-triene-9,17-dione monooxygenase